MDDQTKVAKTLALQLAPQLPEDFVQAGLVLQCLEELRQWRSCPGNSQVAKSGDHEVVLLRREAVGGSANSPSWRPSRIDSPSVLPK
jgi:hypothetical protein